MSSFSIPLTGLKAASSQMNTIANNLSNMNTTAFKSQNETFSDLFYQQIGTTGSGNPLQVGAGTRVAATATDFSQGGIQSTGNATDLYINGNGFFLVRGSSDGTTELTRDGNFTTNGGYLVTQDGLNVMGYPAANGAVNSSAQLSPIQLPVGQVENAKATTTMSMTANLNASDAAGTTVQGQVPIYDSLGNPHEATVYFTKTGTNAWSYSFSLDPKTITDTSSATTRTLTPTASGGNTTIPFDAGATVDPSTSFTISDGTTTVNAPAASAGESLNTYLAALQTALSSGGSTATASVSGNTLTITGGTVTGTVAEGGITSYAYNLDAGATLDPSTSLTITGTNASGNSATITAPPIAPGETLSAYASALTTAVGSANLQGVAVSVTGNGLSISGPGISLGGSLTESAAGTASANATGSLVFDSSGNLVSPSANVAGIQLGGLTDGAANLSLTWDLYGTGGAGLITQSAVGNASSTNPVTGTLQDGYASGSYQGFSVDASGVVSATFSNGQTQVVGQVALANVANLQGLTIQAGNNYATTTASGPATMGIAGSGGLGTLQDKALEESNVDISSQFADLIVAQQAFQASSKAITTFDTISQDTINMIH
ncbi:MAG: flagellar hook-basal body complex protein [Acidobacteriota bacterium]